uniref:NAD-dependent epimerase/dehydratase family protein n=1 Tax=Eiseniibacteriota bacterium TaxID=2212470 RepID=A0A832I5L4_UNCEI
MKYLVTGATGFVGGRLARRLVADGHAVVALVRDPGRAGELAALGVDVRRGDVTAPHSLAGPMRGVDGVFHVAGWYRIGARTAAERRAAWAINLEGSRHVFAAMAAAGVPKGIYTSTLAVYGDTRGAAPDESHAAPPRLVTLYDRTKHAAHHEAAVPAIRGGLPLVIVQPGLIYGPGDTSSVRVMLRRYLRRRLPLVPRGTAYCWAHVDDVVEGHVRAMERGRPGECYHLAGPRHTLVEALALCERLTGVPGPRVALGPAWLRAMAAIARLVEPVVPLPPGYTSEGLRVVAGVTYLGDASKARRELGWSARPLEQGLREVLFDEMRALGMTPPV